MSNGPKRLDPVYVSSRREAIQILAIWGCCLLWTIGYSRWAGYHISPGELSTVLGMPSWVMWGIVVPWIAAGAATIGFALFVIEENPRDALDGESSAPSESPGGGQDA